MTEVQQRVYHRCLEMKSEWKQDSGRLIEIIKLADVQEDGFKRIVVNGVTYLVPIEDIICFGIVGWQVPLKYKQEVEFGGVS